MANGFSMIWRARPASKLAYTLLYVEAAKDVRYILVFMLLHKFFSASFTQRDPAEAERVPSRADPVHE